MNIVWIQENLHAGPPTKEFLTMFPFKSWRKRRLWKVIGIELNMIRIESERVFNKAHYLATSMVVFQTWMSVSEVSGHDVHMDSTYSFLYV